MLRRLGAGYFARSILFPVASEVVGMDKPGDEIDPVLLSVDAGPLKYQEVLDRLIAEES